MSKAIKITKKEVLSHQKYLLSKVSYDYKNTQRELKSQTREVFNRGNGATILLYNKEKGAVILTRQFRLPTYLNGNKEGMMIEACAGQLDDDDPEECIRRETEEETGYRIAGLQKIFEAYTTPGAVTEMLYFYVAPYTEEMKVAKGGGLEEEGEDIEVLEIAFHQACEMIKGGEIKDSKTILLLQYAQIHRLLEK